MYDMAEKLIRDDRDIQQKMKDCIMAWLTKQEPKKLETRGW